MYAAEHGRVEHLRYLIDVGADKDAMESVRIVASLDEFAVASA